MSYVEELHRAHQERLARLGYVINKKQEKIKPRPVPVVIQFSKQMQEIDEKDEKKTKDLLHELWLRRRWRMPKIHTVTVSEIQKICADTLGISLIELLGPHRQPRFVYPRQIAYYLTRAITGKGFITLGRRFNRDHTSVMHGHEKIEKLIDAGDVKVMHDVARVRNRITCLETGFNPLHEFMDDLPCEIADSSALSSVQPSWPPSSDTAVQML